jgi:periplasmic protein TonB
MKKIFFVAFFIVSTFSFLKAQNDTVLFFNIDEVADDSILNFAEQMPQFPGGNSARIAFIKRNLNYPVIARENKIEGTVQIEFVVRKDGNISDVKALKRISWGFDAEAIRVVKLMRCWIPGKQNGKEVNIRFVLPIVFKLKN